MNKKIKYNESLIETLYKSILYFADLKNSFVNKNPNEEVLQKTVEFELNNILNEISQNFNIISPDNINGLLNVDIISSEIEIFLLNKIEKYTTANGLLIEKLSNTIINENQLDFLNKDILIYIARYLSYSELKLLSKLNKNISINIEDSIFLLNDKYDIISTFIYNTLNYLKSDSTTFVQWFKHEIYGFFQLINSKLNPILILDYSYYTPILSFSVPIQIECTQNDLLRIWSILFFSKQSQFITMIIINESLNYISKTIENNFKLFIEEMKITPTINDLKTFKSYYKKLQSLRIVGTDNSYENSKLFYFNIISTFKDLYFILDRTFVENFEDKTLNNLEKKDIIKLNGINGYIFPDFLFKKSLDKIGLTYQMHYLLDINKIIDNIYFIQDNPVYFDGINKKELGQNITWINDDLLDLKTKSKNNFLPIKLNIMRFSLLSILELENIRSIKTQEELFKYTIKSIGIDKNDLETIININTTVYLSGSIITRTPSLYKVFKVYYLIFKSIKINNNSISFDK